MVTEQVAVHFRQDAKSALKKSGLKLDNIEWKKWPQLLGNRLESTLKKSALKKFRKSGVRFLYWIIFPREGVPKSELSGKPTYCSSCTAASITIEWPSDL